MSYFLNIKNGIKTTRKGLSLTLKHFWAARKTKGSLNITDKDYFLIDSGTVTLQYPHETIDVPDNGRYQLDCEIDDCIVCDKCAKICPVDCIDIEVIKSSELIRTTSDGSPVRLHAAKFDIDMAKCCFCGLCTTVCPTECLTMNSEYDYSVLDITKLNFAFSNLTEQEADEKRELYAVFVAEKEALKATQEIKPIEIENKPSVGFKPKPFFPKNQNSGVQNENMPLVSKSEDSESKPKFMPKMAPKPIINEDLPEIVVPNKPPAFVPKLKPQIGAKSDVPIKNDTDENDVNLGIEPQKIVSKFVPKLKPKA